VSFARLHKVVSYLIAGLGLAALSLGPELTTASELAIVAAFVGSWFAEGRLIREPRWVRGWTVGLFGLLGLQVLRGALGAAILPLVLEFTAALQLSRLFNRRGAREHQHIGALALLHLIAATVLSTELSYALAFLGFVIVAPWMLSLGHLRAEIEAQRRSAEPEDREEAVQRVLASKRLVGPGFLAGTAALALPLFALTGLLFIAFPRVGLGFLSFGRDVGRRVTGFGANVELGDFGVIRSDPTVVLRVTPPDLGERPPLRAALRLRGTSFDHYDGRRWTRSRDLESDSAARIDAYYAVPVRLPRPSEDEPWEIVLDPLDEPVIFLPPDTVGLEVPPRVVGGIDVGREIRQAPGLDIRYADADGLGLRYTAWTSDAPADAEPSALSPDEARRYLQVPEGQERVAALARRWTEGAEDDAARVRRLLARLRDSGELTYSLEMPDVGERNPLDVFLFDARRGHCEYFSTAMTVMLRTLGVPARNVTGFLGGRYNAYGRYYALSQGDAHSWVEAWLPGEGWVTVDPTPPARDDIAPDPGIFATLREVIDALRTRWSQDVVGYDLRQQMGLLRTLRRWLVEARPRGPDAAAAPAAEAPTDDAPELPGWSWIVLAALGLALVGAARLVLRRSRRQRVAEPAAVRLYRTLERTLAKLGHPRPPERTPLEHVAALAEAGFGELELVREVTRRYLEARFGGEPLASEEAERLHRAVKAMRRRRDLFASAR
jgi:transglutaminase-like putative cysteine protease